MATSIKDFFQCLHSRSVCGVWGAASRITRGTALHIKGQGSLAAMESSLRCDLAVAYHAGYAYHQTQVRESPELLAWVLKPDYWDGRLPSLDGAE